MGHIINAKSMRLGWTNIWPDQWYTELYYYSEYLHSLFKIKFYLIYIFTRRHFDKKAIFYSHFELIKYYKKIYIEIYYYSGKLENDFENFKFEFFYKLHNYEFQKDPETRKPKFLFIPIKLFIIWSWALNFRLEILKYKFIGIISQIIRKYKLKYLKKLFYKNKIIKKFKIKLPIFFYFCLLLSIYIKSKQIINKISIYKPKKNTIFRRLYMLIGCYKTMYSYIFCFSIILNYIFNKLTINKFKFNIEFFLINNNCINAKFLSRYLCRKLKQNYPIKELINPIKKDLLYVLKLSITPKKSYYKNLNKKELLYLNNKQNNKFLFKNIIIFIQIIYKLTMYKYFFISKVFITLELFLINIKINKINNIPIYEKIKVLQNYYKKKSIFISFFDTNLQLIYPQTYNIKSFNNINKIINLISIKIYDFIYIGWLNNFWNIDKYNLTKTNFKWIKFSCINFNNYLKFNYWIYQIYLNTKYNHWKLNNLKSRNKYFTKANNLIGYKMYLSGRFKRKQRAAYFWFSKGKVPLNTLKACIDYSYYTIALKNSAICVKIWLYKSDNLSNLYYIKIY